MLMHTRSNMIPTKEIVNLTIETSFVVDPLIHTAKTEGFTVN